MMLQEGVAGFMGSSAYHVSRDTGASFWSPKTARRERERRWHWPGGEGTLAPPIPETLATHLAQLPLGS